ncbi:MAG: UDP-N-acetylglucosamine 2-epimerase [Desulfarculus sp.]|nr:UDP-N-acetylglucosamine 2-epimerase [Desulfarculus sp.]
MRKICVVVGSRANYSSIKSVMRAVAAHPDLELQLVVGASALLDRFGSVVDVIEADGFTANAKVHMIIEGENPVTMAKSTGLGLMELPTIFDNLRPDVVITVGDRFETMATAIAAAYMSVYVVGCPRIDLVAEIVRNDGRNLDKDLLFKEGVGGHLDPDLPFLLVSQHPVTTEFGQSERQVHETLLALAELRMPTVMLWPNVDAGSDDLSRGIRKFRERQKHDHIRFYKNFPVETFVRLMLRCACMIGNSSAMVREGAFLGVPSVNVGSRQDGRERGANVIDVPHDQGEILDAVRRQLVHGRYPSQPIYGDGTAGRRIADILARLEGVKVQKRIAY